MKFGELLKITRIVYGFATQQDLANYAKVHVATIERYEKTIFSSEKMLEFYQTILGWNLSAIYLFIQKRRTELETGEGYVELLDRPFEEMFNGNKTKEKESKA